MTETSTNTSLKALWGLRPWPMPHGMLDLSGIDTSLPALEAIFRRMPADKLFVRVPGPGPASGQPARIALSDVGDLARHLDGGHRLHLLAIELQRFDPAHAAALQRFVERVAAEVPEAGRCESEPKFSLFLSTPGVVAPFHADCEHNFLFQVVGDKHIHFWDREDHQLLQPLARERLACEEDHVLDTYRPEIEARATVFHLTPNVGVYHPPMAPHWVDTGRAGWSLSYAVSFETHSVDRLRLIHKVNRQLRRLGLQPGEVGRSPLVDGLKHFAGRGLRQLKRLTG